MKACGIAICCFVLMSASGCTGSRPAQPEESFNHVPDFRIVELQSTSTAKQKRFEVKIVLPSHYSENSVRSTLATIADTINEPKSELTMLFYGPHSYIRGPYDVARVVWNDGDLAELDYKPPGTAPKSSLRNSGRFGLLGMPLPEGAKLIERTPGNPSLGIDTKERYSLEADSDSIIVFFKNEMIKAGWANNGVISGTSMFFTKGPILVEVGVDKKGKSFTLMGS